MLQISQNNVLYVLLFIIFRDPSILNLLRKPFGEETQASHHYAYLLYRVKDLKECYSCNFVDEKDW